MVKYPLYLIAVGAAVSFGAVTQAAAGGCCPGCACGPVVVEQVLEPSDLPSPIYVVNQGPVFSGPGPFIRQVPESAPKAYPGSYPYVGFVYSGYPYGYYRPWIGGPYADPINHHVVHRYVDERIHYRVKRPAMVYHRHVGARIIHVSK